MAAPPLVVGRVAELWRYPVKSLGGERLEALALARRGGVGDRAWAVRGADGKIGSGKTTRRLRRMPGLLSVTAHTDEAGQVWVRFPAGDASAVSDPRTAERIGAVVGERVWLAEEGATSHFDDAPLHVLTSGSLAWLAARRPGDQIETRRFRPNVVVETAAGVGAEASGAEAGAAIGRPEDDWVGRTLLLGGEVRATVRKGTERCVMTTLAQPGLGFAPRVLKELESSADGLLGVYADVVAEGLLRVGDEVALEGA